MGCRRPVEVPPGPIRPTPRSRWIKVDGGLRKEIADRLTALGYKTLEDWLGVENLEERVDGQDAIDPFVLEHLRDRSS